MASKNEKWLLLALAYYFFVHRPKQLELEAHGGAGAEVPSDQARAAAGVAAQSLPVP